MGHPRKNQETPCCYHVTHRCHERSFLLKFGKDRRNYLRRVREAAGKYDVSVLDYIITSNHVHLLLHATKASVVSELMRHIQGNSARDYNKRKSREGAFWRGRYHPTMIQPGGHLTRCLFYIDMNMVRAGKCGHPAEWPESGYHELVGARRRRRIIDMARLLICLEHPGDEAGFMKWYSLTLEDHIKTHYHAREAIWTESLAIGGREWLEKLGKGVHGLKIKTLSLGHDRVGEEHALYSLSGSGRAKEAFWRKRQG